MFHLDNFLTRFTARTLIGSMLMLSIPFGAFANTSKLVPAKKKALEASRKLDLFQLRKLKGRGPNHNYAGNEKWQPVYKGVNLLTGNLLISATDLSFEGGFGPPIAISRTYSLNSEDEGPLGYGWTLSVDVRSTAGGVLKSGSAPVRQVPVQFRERPRIQGGGSVGGGTPSLADPVPVDAVVTVDASGKENVVQRDVDGVLSTPLWDNNVIESEYETVTTGSGATAEEWTIQKSCTVKTIDGMVYHYGKHGTYPNGAYNPDRHSGTVGNDGVTPSNVLLLDSAQDRFGNATTYSYSSTAQATFETAAGTITIDELQSISTANGYRFNFTWATQSGKDRMTEIEQVGISGQTEYVSDDYKVSYAYNSGGDLQSVTSPAGYVTGYTYNGHELSATTDLRGFTTEYIIGDRDDLAGTPRGIRETKNPEGTSTLYSKGGAAVDTVVKNGTEYVLSGAYVSVRSDVGSDDEGLFAGIGQIPMVRRATTDNGYLFSGFTNFVDSPTQWLTVQLESYGTSDQTFEINRSVYDPYTLALEEQVNAHVANSTLSNERTGRLASLPGAEFSTSSNPWNRPLTYGYLDLSNVRKMGLLQGVQYVANYQLTNFKGDPLVSVAVEGGNLNTGNSGTWQASNIKRTLYAYWGKDKYFQQKAIVAPNDAISYTDYYIAGEANGAPGEVKEVVPQKLDTSSFSNSFSSNPIASGLSLTATSNLDGSNGNWRSAITPVTGYQPSAKFQYDSNGRSTLIQKAHSVSGSTASYVTTSITNGAALAPWYGNPLSVTEAAGTSIERTTSTESYDLRGKATHTQVTGTPTVGNQETREYLTEYDKDGRILSTWTPDTPLKTYTYGAAGTATAGQLTNVYDAISDYSYDVSYYTTNNASTGAMKGRVSQVDDQQGFGFDHGRVRYQYNEAGDLASSEQAVFDAGSNVTRSVRYRYHDYLPVGSPLGQSRVYQTLTVHEMLRNAQGNWVETETPEEFHYSYDAAGRLSVAAFAQTHSTDNQNLSDFTNLDGTSSYYPVKYRTSGSGTENYACQLATRRATATYAYDPAGRLLNLKDYWQTLDLNTRSYSSNNFLKYEYEYDPATGQKTDEYATAGGTTTHDAYSYNGALGYLTGVTYNVGAGQSTTNWSYDAGGNRTDGSADALNEQLSHGGNSYRFDSFGNRLWKNYGQTSNVVRYDWNIYNQLENYVPISGNGGSYSYRADGLRRRLVRGIFLNAQLTPEGQLSGYFDVYNEDNDTTVTYYDGEMPVEEEHTFGSAFGPSQTDVTRNVVGPRGIDMSWTMTNWSDNANWTTATRSFPLYDGHGNNVMTLSRSGSSFATSSLLKYDVWGGIRSGTPEGPNRYCANLGHKQDDESGLIYMRARYYDSQSGTFISSDPSMQGSNWYSYCGNDPISRVDHSGRTYLPEMQALMTAFMAELATWQGPVSGFLFRARQFMKMMRSLIRFAKTEGNLWQVAAAGALDPDTHDFLRGRVAKCRAEQITGTIYLFEMALMLGLKVSEECSGD